VTECLWCGMPVELAGDFAVASLHDLECARWVSLLYRRVQEREEPAGTVGEWLRHRKELLREER
jgi:hypothetical protein